MYIVAKGHSYISKGITYNPGDEISVEAFSSEASFLGKVKKGHIVLILGETKESLDEEITEAQKKADEKLSQNSGVELAHEAALEMAKEGVKIAKEGVKTAKEEEKKAESLEAKAVAAKKGGSAKAMLAAAESDLEKAKE
jgi:hypothetical protein